MQQQSKPTRLQVAIAVITAITVSTLRSAAILYSAYERDVLRIDAFARRAGYGARSLASGPDVAKETG